MFPAFLLVYISSPSFFYSFPLSFFLPPSLSSSCSLLDYGNATEAINLIDIHSYVRWFAADARISRVSVAKSRNSSRESLYLLHTHSRLHTHLKTYSYTHAPAHTHTHTHTHTHLDRPHRYIFTHDWTPRASYDFSRPLLFARNRQIILGAVSRQNPKLFQEFWEFYVTSNY